MSEEISNERNKTLKKSWLICPASVGYVFSNGEFPLTENERAKGPFHYKMLYNPILFNQFSYSVSRKIVF